MRSNSNLKEEIGFFADGLYFDIFEEYITGLGCVHNVNATRNLDSSRGLVFDLFRSILGIGNRGEDSLKTQLGCMFMVEDERG